MLRIEAALTRLDAASDRLADAPAHPLDAQRVRQELAAAIGELDQLIAASGESQNG